jgi:hypothetical protein
MLLLLSPRMWEDFAKAGDREICASAGLCCSRSLPMLSRTPAGNYGCSKVLSFRYRVSSSARSPFPSCIFCHGASCKSLTRLAAAPFAVAVESITCGWLAFVVLGALLAQLLIGAWWVDALASLGVVWFVIREGREAWEGEDCCDQHCK